MKKTILIVSGIVILAAASLIIFAQLTNSEHSTQINTTTQNTGFFRHILAQIKGQPDAPKGLVKPAIPAKGAYLGAWVNPNDPNKNKDSYVYPSQKEITQLPAYNAQIGKPAAILHMFMPFGVPVPPQALTAIDANGSIPMVDLQCSNLEDIIAGKNDASLIGEANDLKNFGKPVFLRWYWEMNHDKRDECNATVNPAHFIAAWQHIYTIFQQQGAANVAFVWCPSARSRSEEYYPGNAYVDWIAGDGFVRDNEDTKERKAGISLDDLYGNLFYSQWAGHGKPLMMAATGAETIDQAQYFTQIQTELPTKYPEIKAVIYFDSVGDNGNYALAGTGITAFKKLAYDPYFMFR